MHAALAEETKGRRAAAGRQSRCSGEWGDGHAALAAAQTTAWRQTPPERCLTGCRARGCRRRWGPDRSEFRV